MLKADTLYYYQRHPPRGTKVYKETKRRYLLDPNRLSFNAVLNFYYDDMPDPSYNFALSNYISYKGYSAT